MRKVMSKSHDIAGVGVGRAKQDAEITQSLRKGSGKEDRQTTEHDSVQKK
ncbi:hypothetical protein [Salinicoccus sp. Marseille-QA3877]